MIKHACPLLALLLSTSPVLAGGPDEWSCPHCPTLDGNDVVNVNDLVMVVLNWGPCADCIADIDGSGEVDVSDLVQVVLDWGPCPAPPNDDCGDAAEFQWASGPTHFFKKPDFCTLNATTDGPTVTDCGSYNQLNADVWYRVTAPVAGLLRVTTCTGFADTADPNADFNTKLAIYGTNFNGVCNCPGGFPPPPLLACNDNTPGVGLCSTVEAPAFAAGDCFRVRVGGFIAAQGAGELYFYLIKWGEECVAPIELPHGDGDDFVSIIGTTIDNDSTITVTDVSSCAFNDVIDEWYLYHPTGCDATVTVSTCYPQTNFDTTLAVYSTCFDEIACDDDSCASALWSQVSFNITSSETQPYLIRIAGHNGTTGSFRMTVDTDCIGGQ